MSPCNSNLWDEGELVSDADNAYLTGPFSEEEIKFALFRMEKNKAAGPDSFPVEFFQGCWEIVKHDILELFQDFWDGRLNVSGLNYGIITLLPKVMDAEKIQQYRPICLLNCLYKWITNTTGTCSLEANSAFLISFHEEKKYHAWCDGSA